MAIDVSERPLSRRVTVSAMNPSAEFLCIARGSDNDVDIRNAIINYLPKFYANLVLLIDSVDIDPQDGGIWYGSAKYARPTVGTQADGKPIDGQGVDAQPPNEPEKPEHGDQTPLGPETSWETAGGSVKLSKSYQVVSSWVNATIANAGGAPPDYKGAIGVTKEGVAGIELPAPQFSWSRTYRFAFVTDKYLRTLRRLTGTVNNGPWKERGRREVRFDGSSGKIGSDGWAEITFKFSEQETQFDVTIGDDITIPDVKGWDYIDVLYGPAVDKSFLIEIPQVAFVHRVYRETDFKDLGIG